MAQENEKQQKHERAKKESAARHAEENDKMIKQMLANDYADMRKEEIGNAFECAVCGDTFDEDVNEAYTLTGCEHYFHTDCLFDYFESQLSDGKFDLLCPDQACQKPVADFDLKQVMSDPSKVEKLQRQRFNHLVDSDASMFYCPTPDCQYVYEKNKGHKESTTCPLCDFTFCLTCRQKFVKGIHRCGAPPGEKESVDLFKKFMVKRNFAKCNKCKIAVERIDGCLNITCRCKNQFCY